MVTLYVMVGLLSFLVFLLLILRIRVCCLKRKGQDDSLIGVGDLPADSSQILPIRIVKAPGSDYLSSPGKKSGGHRKLKRITQTV
jgi:hypothetical protein